MTEPDNLPPSLSKEWRVYSISPDLRRSAIYIMASFVGLGLFSVWLGQFVLMNDLKRQFFTLAGFILVASVMTVPLRWRLVVNDRGIARRRLLNWDLWSWADFASGRVEKVYPHAFYDSQRRWWQRKLNIGFLKNEDAAELTELINEVYRFPDMPEVPETVTIKYGWRRKFVLDANGLHATIRGRNFDWTWTDVRRLRLIQHDGLRRDFKMLQLFLPNETMELQMVTHEGGTTCAWSGVTSEILTEFLQQHLPTEKIDFDIVGERPSRTEDVQRALIEFEKERQGMRFIYGGLGCMSIALLAYCLWKREFWAASVFAFSILPFSPVFWWAHKSRTALRERLESWLAELQTEADS